MLFNVVLFSSLLVAPLVLAIPSGLGARFARRGEGIRSQVNNRLEQRADGVFNTVYSTNWAGAVWNKGNGTFSTVTGTFTVPTPSGPDGAGAAAWVGIDGDTCTSSLFQTGVTFSTESGEPTYNAWYEWIPAPSYGFSDISISAGDVIKLTIIAWSADFGTATIENLTNGQLVSKSLNSSAPLCGQNAEWIIEDYDVDGSSVPLANFGTVEFTNAVATGTGRHTPTGATINDNEQNGTVLTNVSTNGASVTIQYV